ncbi:MAG: barstar family protein [Oscillospiraceae bacterium]|jgi:ribonuclease inhibitor|nr:barstar family protein [Oscillospiraceae bacterium]
MKNIVIDFTGCNHVQEVHLIIKEKLEFPDWYGENIDALWDLLTGYIDPCDIYLEGCQSVAPDLIPYIKKIKNIFIKAAQEYHELKVDIYD